jgi:hypothetical protein
LQLVSRFSMFFFFFFLHPQMNAGAFKFGTSGGHHYLHEFRGGGERLVARLLFPCRRFAGFSLMFLAIIGIFFRMHF